MKNDAMQWLLVLIGFMAALGVSIVIELSSRAIGWYQKGCTIIESINKAWEGM